MRGGSGRVAVSLDQADQKPLAPHVVLNRLPNQCFGYDGFFRHDVEEISRFDRGAVRDAEVVCETLPSTERMSFGNVELN